MGSAVFEGKYFPSCIIIEDAKIEITIDCGDLIGTKISLHFGEQNKITALCDTPSELSKLEAGQLWEHVNAIVKGYIDIAAFFGGTAISYSLEFSSISGEDISFILSDARLIQQIPANISKFPVIEINRLTGSSPSFRLILADLNEAINFPPARLINCARAIETIRNEIAPNAHRREVGWATMRSHLNISEQYLRSITSASAGPRHGDRIGVSDATSDQVMQRTWAITGRFIAYKFSGSEPLDPCQFLILNID